MVVCNFPIASSCFVPHSLSHVCLTFYCNSLPKHTNFSIFPPYSPLFFSIFQRFSHDEYLLFAIPPELVTSAPFQTLPLFSSCLAPRSQKITDVYLLNFDFNFQEISLLLKRVLWSPFGIEFESTSHGI